MIKKWNVKLFFYLFTIFLIGGISGWFYLNLSEPILAKPDDGNPLIINKESKSEYPVPYDGKKIIEPTLSPIFSNYVQNISKKGNIEKKNLESLSSNGDSQTKKAILGSDGNYLSVILQTNGTNEWVTGITTDQIYLIKSSPSGKILKSYNVANGGNSMSVTENSKTDGLFARNMSEIFRDSKGKKFIVYDGFTPDSKEVQKRVVYFDDFLENISYGKFNLLSESGIESNLVTNLINDDKLVKLGVYMMDPKIADTTPFDFPIKSIDFATNTENLIVTFHFPIMGTINPDASKAIESLACLTLTNIISTSDGGYLVSGFTSNPVVNSPVRRMEHLFKFSPTGDIQWFKTTLGRYNLQLDISDKKILTVLETKDNQTSQLINFDMANGKTSMIKEYPINTKIDIIKNKNNDFGTFYDFYGYVEELSGEFNGFIGKPGLVLGSMNEDFAISSINSIQADARISVSNLLPIKDTNKYFISGVTTSKSFANPPTTGWINKLPHIAVPNDLFFGEIEKNEDFSPAISKVTDMEIDISDKSLNDRVSVNEMGWNCLSNWLITGTKNGKLSDDNALKVTDTIDLTNESIGLTKEERQNWLNKRINRNPNDQKLSIDWFSLGFDQTKPGPQLVTYFVTDSQKQASVTSRWTNKVNDTTIKSDDYAFDAHNFTISLKDIQSGALSTNHDIRKIGKILAWNMTNHEIDEDAVSSHFNDEEILFTNTDQVTTLRNATEAKPYPIDITYKSAKINKTLWVFVTDDQTTVDDKKDKVIYGKNYNLTVPKESKNETVELSYQHSNIEVYSLRYGKLLANSLNSKGLSVSSKELSAIQNEKKSNNLPLTFIYSDDFGSVAHAIVVDLTVSIADVVVSFQDEDGVEQAQKVLLSGNIFTNIDLTKEEEIKNTIQTVLDKGFELVQRPEHESEILIEEDGTSVKYVFKGLVWLKTVTDKMGFSQGEITPFDQTLKYNGTENFQLSVVDQRGQKNQGEGKKRGQISVQASLSRVFSNKNEKKLNGSLLIYEDGKDSHEINELGTIIYENKKSNEATNYNILLDDKKTGNKGLRFFVPKGSLVEKGTYTAEITWELAEGP